MTTFTGQILPRRMTAAQWILENPVLGPGERGYETDTHKEKLGDGSTVWTSLPYVGGSLRTVASISFAATVTPALPSPPGDVIYNVGTLTGGITIANPTGIPFDGQNMQFTFAQDATGNRVITWGSAFSFGTDITQSLIPTGSNSKWRMLFVYNAQVSKWQAVAIARGF